MDRFYFLYRVVVEMPFDYVMNFLEFTYRGKNAIIETDYNYDKRVVRMTLGVSSLSSLYEIASCVELHSCNLLSARSIIPTLDEHVRSVVKPIFNF